MLTILQQLPFRLYASVLRGLVTSVNARVIGQAQQMVRELKTVTPDVINLVPTDPTEEGEMLSIDKFNEEEGALSAYGGEYLQLLEMGLTKTNRPKVIGQLLRYRHQLLGELDAHHFSTLNLELQATMDNMMSGQIWQTSEQFEEVAKQMSKKHPEVTAKLLGDAVRLDTISRAAALRNVHEKVIDIISRLTEYEEAEEVNHEITDWWPHLSQELRESLIQSAYQRITRAKGWTLRDMARMNLEAFGNYEIIVAVEDELKAFEEALVSDAAVEMTEEMLQFDGDQNEETQNEETQNEEHREEQEPEKATGTHGKKRRRK